MIPTTDIVVNGTPLGWRTVPFWSLFRREKKIGFPDEELLSVYRDYGVIPKSSREDNHNKESEDLSGYQLVTEGALVTNKMKAWQGSIAISRYRGIVSPAYYVYTPQSDECDQFLHYLLRSDPYIGLYGRISKGVRVNQWDLEHEALRNIPVLLPDLPTQRQIADFLDRETARIDLLIEKKQRFLSLASERWRAVLNHHIFPNSPAWEGLPKHWTKTLLKFLTDQKRPIMYGIVLPGPNMEFGPMIVKGGDVKPGRLDPEKLCRTTVEIESSYVRSRLKAGDLVISIRGSIGDVEIVPSSIEGANLTQDAARIAPRNGVDVQWLRYVLQSTAVFHPLEAKSLGAAVRGINIFDLKRVYVPTPPNEEQARIASALSVHEQRLADLKSKVLTHADRLKEYRSALITAAVTGQIDVSTWSRSGATDRRLDAIQEEMGG